MALRVVRPEDDTKAPDLPEHHAGAGPRRRDGHPARSPARPNLTDYGNAQRFVAMHGHEVRYCPAWGTWLVWDGLRWHRDHDMEVERRAKKTVLAMYSEAATLDDDQDRRDLAEWAKKSESKKRLVDMIALTRSEPGVTVSPGDFDSDPWLLNCRNGTVDLRTGDLKEHNPADLITKLVPVDYVPGAACPCWGAFLCRVMGSDDAMVGYLRRIAGYALTGETREHCLFFLHGLGRNGKSTYLNALREVMGDYAMTASPSLLMASDRDRHSTELTDLDGRRLVVTTELEDNKRFAESLVKSVTGGDAIRARKLYKDNYEFTPSFKLFVAANHRPEIRGTDEGIWSRIRLIPFTVTIPPGERDGALAEKLRAEAPGILAWAVQGCLEWQRGGLREPEAVVEATAAYRGEMDPIGDFLAGLCVADKSARCKAGELYAAYKGWCAATGNDAISLKAFGQRLEERGIRSKKTSGLVCRLGLRLRESVPASGAGCAARSGM